ncbi:MAG: CHAT domain-containing protein [Oscillatoria sp. SIO1A7]|nr:CHAT domain-containing protein [Oscillatoria sp. SIO1A7]
MEIFQTIAFAILGVSIPAAILHPNPAKAEAPKQSPYRPKSHPTKLATLIIRDGNFESGFPVILQICNGHFFPATFFGKLPPAAEIPEMYKECQYSPNLCFRLSADKDTITNFSVSETYKPRVRKLEQYLNTWLGSESFRPIADKLREKFQAEDEVLLLIHAENRLLQRLPWHAWDFFSAYPGAEYALSSLGDTEKQFKQQKPQPIAVKQKLRILAILGNSKGINIEVDREEIAKFSKADVVFLDKPNREELNRHLWDERGWDVFYFSGHSSSSEDGATGTISLDQNEKLAIADFKFALKGAISRGLQLVILNSCDGLGLATELADLDIPQAIVMRESVPDKVAQEFLKYLLGALARGKSLPLAFREAREKLESLDNFFPSAMWLPVLFQNQITQQY